MYVGDFRLSATVYTKFTTVDGSGIPAALAAGVISAYPAGSTTQLTAGITLTADFDSVTGLNHVAIVASGANGYLTATDYELVITTGTVGGLSVVGYVVGQFSIENRSALMPTTTGRTLDVSSGGEAGVDWANVGSPTTTVGLTGTTIAVSQVVASVSGAVGSVTGAVGSVTGNVGGNVLGSVAGAVGSVAGSVGGNVTGSVGSVAGAVASVTGNVGGNVVGSVGSLATQAKADVNAEVATQLDATVADSVPADGTRFALRSGMYAVTQFLFERSQSSTTLTVGKVTGSTLMTFTLNSATLPTSITRAT